MRCLRILPLAGCLISSVGLADLSASADAIPYSHQQRQTPVINQLDSHNLE